MSDKASNHNIRANYIHKKAWSENDYWLNYDTPTNKKIFEGWDKVVGRNPSESTIKNDAYLYYSKLTDQIKTNKLKFYKR